MKTRLASIRQHVEEAQQKAAELMDLCQKANDDKQIERAFDIEMALEWTRRRAKEFDAALP